MDAINYFVAFAQSFQAALKNVVNVDSVKLVEECVEAAQDALAIVLKEYSHASFWFVSELRKLLEAYVIVSPVTNVYTVENGIHTENSIHFISILNSVDQVVLIVCV